MSHAPAANRKRILIVEDDVSHQDFFAAILRPFFEVLVCPSLEEALEKIAKESFDLIISDIQLFGMSGLEILEQGRRTGRLENCPVVFCSSRTDMETRRQAIALGAAEFISKPCKPALIISTVNALLNGPSAR